MKASIAERAGTMLDVKGRFANVRYWDNGLFSTQTFNTEYRPCPSQGEFAKVRAELRFDDNCRNGHNSFSICGTVRDTRYGGDRGEIAGGQVTEEIAEAFPELVPLLQWHLMDTTGPMHYIANTVYLAGDRDYRGLRKGETKPLISRRTGLPCWELMAVRNGDEKHESVHTLDRLLSSVDEPVLDYVVKYVPSMIIGEGKDRQLDAARRCAVWPDATDEELCQDKAALTQALNDRAPALLAAFKDAVVGCGFKWE